MIVAIKASVSTFRDDLGLHDHFSMVFVLHASFAGCSDKNYLAVSAVQGRICILSSLGILASLFFFFAGYVVTDYLPIVAYIRFVGYVRQAASHVATMRITCKTF